VEKVFHFLNRQYILWFVKIAEIKEALNFYGNFLKKAEKIGSNR